MSRTIQWPGLVSRQALADFCREKLPALKKRNDELGESLEIFEARGDIHSAHAVYEGLQFNYGYQTALRDVCEWAKNHLVEDNPVVEPKDPVDFSTQRKRLQDKFNV